MKRLLPLAACMAIVAGTAPVPNRAPLQPNALNPLPLTSVKPAGWLLDQLKIQASGLSGHLGEFWPDVGANSAWLGGTGEGWERGPYYLDGLVPLAYLTGDARLIAKVRQWMDWTLDHQSPEGWLGPAKNRDWWPNFVMLKALTQFEEATGDARVVPAMEKYFAYQARHLDERPLKQWAVFRWHDETLSVPWLCNRDGDPKLLDLARRLHAQGHDWEAQFADFRYTSKVGQPDINLSTHGVNNAMALKAAAVWWLLTGKATDRASLGQMLTALDRYHGEPNGIFSSDEHYAGRDPSQGTELGDRLEKIAYNALPGTMTADLWAHQYDQQANQAMCSLSKRRWTDNGPDSNIFGLEPNFGCCTANMHQGWPKLAANLRMQAPGGGLAAAVYGPSEVKIAAPGNVAVTLTEETGYPFRETVAIRVAASAAARFPLLLRIPGWATRASVSVNGQARSGVRAGEFFRIEREWRNGDAVELRFPMDVRITRWYRDSVAVERGPLVYSLKIGESWRKRKQTGPALDWEVFPTTPWNYALVVNPADPAGAFEVRERPFARQPYLRDAAPVEIVASARRLPEWQLEDDSAGPVPESPATSKQPVETVTIIPYGAAKLRITAFPYTPRRSESTSFHRPFTRPSTECNPESLH